MNPSDALPPVHSWQAPDDIREYTLACLAALGLHAWDFGWDRAIKRLGCCHITARRITLSAHFVRAHLTDHTDIIRDTVLHEIAHAIVWERHRKLGHGAEWKHYCRLLGATPRATTSRSLDFSQRPPTYILRLRTTGETIRTYHRKPRFRGPVKRLYLPGRPDTLGQLELVRYTPPEPPAR